MVMRLPGEMLRLFQQSPVASFATWRAMTGKSTPRPSSGPDNPGRDHAPSYPKHASSPTTRALRQRAVAIAIAGAVVIVLVSLLVTVPQAIRGPSQAHASQGLKAAAQARDDAAAWIGKWVARNAIVACDQLMCLALQAHGLPASRLLPITSSSADPLGSDVIAATAAVRALFGRRLTSVYAPEMLGSFGSGSAEVAVRVISPIGAAAYRSHLRADLLARRSAGRTLLGNPSISAASPAARQLRSGRVDGRLLMTLATIAAQEPLRIVSFGGAGPRSSPGMPLLSADVTSASAGAGARQAGSVCSPAPPSR